MNLNDYVTLGRSGLRVSPLSLGTMTFGTEWGWGSDEAGARAIFDKYLEAGGNFLDTADGYTNGTSEEWLGKFIGERQLRDKVVLATKFTFNRDPGNPNGGGNGRKHIYQALEASLRRLKTDYIDLYWMHAWDTITPVEEVLSTLDDLVRSGKIRHFGLSDVPAWYASRAQTMAELGRSERLIALQLEYSLVERSIEREHIPAAQQLGLGVVPWSPLAGGFLSGKYGRDAATRTKEGRLVSPMGAMFSRFGNERSWQILDVLLDVARELGRPPAAVALNWVVSQPGVTATIIGATTVAQLDANLAALAFDLPPDARARLNDASKLDLIHPYTFFEAPTQERIKGGVAVRAWVPAPSAGPR